jgi:hypothetical protein
VIFGVNFSFEIAGLDHPVDLGHTEKKNQFMDNTYKRKEGHP